MTIHPPWLRFQAYVVGLPKTGSTSMATLFGNYRTGHEWQLIDLVDLAMARHRGEIDDEAFLKAAGRRLVPPSLEMDSATSHCLYADLLARTFPHAVFMHTVRDVRSWVSSLLDMLLCKRIGRKIAGLAYTRVEIEYISLRTEGTYDVDRDDREDDRVALAPMMRYWASHIREMAAVLPPDRSLRLRTRDIASRLPQIAALAGVPASTLRADLSHSNRAPLRFDRFAAFDGDELRAAYDAHCAELMAELFPEEHAAFVSRRPDDEEGSLAWTTYLESVRTWAADAVARHGPGVTR